MYLEQDVPRDKLAYCVVEERRRPELPLECPLDYHLLASRCWETDPSIRCVGGLGFGAGAGILHNPVFHTQALV